jgi:RNA polymerase sigma-70 factor, ECF subfamily
VSRTTETDDADLLVAYLAGDEAAIRELVERHHRRIYGLCYRYFGDHTDAEDATQDTFLALARAAASFRGSASVTAWLTRVAINACHDIVRRREVRPRAVTHEIPELADAADDVAAWEASTDVQQILARLDPLSRSLLVLVAVEGLSYAEAADLCGVSVAAAKSRVHRARARLSDLLVERRLVAA